MEPIDISPVWSGHPVSFSLATRGQVQYVVFYDAERDLSIASRHLSDKTFDVVRVRGESPVFGAKATPTRTGWDSHNYAALGIDSDGHLHLSGNMHGEPLLYFRTTRPGDIHSFQRLDKMVGERESQVTYPVFLNDSAGRLIYSYRDGWSGNGADLYNVYDTAGKTWNRLLDSPLTDGRSPMNNQTAYAYVKGPSRGPDGLFHMVWVWRDNGNCETNHTVSYARTRDLIHWENSAGAAVQLPITRANGEVVDPVPVKGGAINGNTVLGFDAQRRPIVTYHKYDEAGNTQIYNARREGDGWRIVRASNWNFRWNFQGLGSMIFEVHVGPVETLPDGQMRQSWWNKQDGHGGTYLDPVTLAPTVPFTRPSPYPAELTKVESTFPGMLVRWAEDGTNPLNKDTVEPVRAGGRFVLRWETLRENRDQPIQGPPPPPSMLRLYQLETPTDAR